MPAFHRLTEAGLRTAMRDSRYWQPGHPERAGYGAWVAEGWRALYPERGAARAAVWVRPYVRAGHPVAGHWRAAPPGGAEAIPVGARPPRDRAGQPSLPGQRDLPLEGGVGGGFGGGGRSAPQPWRPPAGQVSPAAAASPPGPRAVGFTPGQVQSKYKHASDFGLPPNSNAANGARFEQTLRAHVEATSTLRIVGTYRGQPVVHYLDPTTRLNVMTDPGGRFISGWRLETPQFRNLWQRGSL